MWERTWSTAWMTWVLHPHEHESNITYHIIQPLYPLHTRINTQYDIATCNIIPPCLLYYDCSSRQVSRCEAAVQYSIWRLRDRQTSSDNLPLSSILDKSDAIHSERQFYAVLLYDVMLSPDMSSTVSYRSHDGGSRIYPFLLLYIKHFRWQ